MEQKFENNEPIHVKARRKSRKSSRRSSGSYKPSELLSKLNKAINVEAIIESPEQSVHDDPDLTKFIGITDLIEAKKAAKQNIEQDLINILKEPEKKVELVVPVRSNSNKEPKREDVKHDVKRASSSREPQKEVKPEIKRAISSREQDTKKEDVKSELKRVPSSQEIKRTESNTKLPPRIPVPRLYSNKPQKIEDAPKIEEPKPHVIIETNQTRQVILGDDKSHEYKMMVRKVRKMLIIFGLAMFILVVFGVVLSVVLSVVINNSCLVKKCDQNTSSGVTLTTISKYIEISDSMKTNEKSSQITTTSTSTITTTSTTTTTRQTTLPVLRKNCDYGFSGVSCEDECGLTYFEANVKITGGVEARSNSWPATAIIHFSYRTNDTSLPAIRSFICGGTLIDRLTVLTAAHCIYDTVTIQNKIIKVVPNEFYPTVESMFKVYLGVHDRSLINFVQNIQPAVEVKVRKIIKHEGYNDKNELNDIAIIKLDRYIEFNQYIQPACLPRSTENFPRINIPAWAMGWGSEASSTSMATRLRNVRLTVYNETFCVNVVSMFEKNWTSQMCAGELMGGKDTCQGDSGGGLFVQDFVNNRVKYVAAGIVSYGEGCGTYLKPGIYTRISYYLDWIKINSG